MKSLSLIVLALVPSAVFCQESIQLVVEPTMTFTIANDLQFDGTFVLSESSLPTDPVRLLQTPNVLSDLELVDEQKSRLAAKIVSLKIARQRQEEQLAKQFEGRPELEQKLQESRTKYRDAVKAASEDILLPFQLDRLKQISLQAALRTGGSRAVDSESFAELLGLTAEQKAELQKKAADAEEKLVVEIRELKQKRHREVLEDVLTKRQLQILDENLGKPISDPAKSTNDPARN